MHELDPLSRALILGAEARVKGIPADMLTPQRRREIQRAGIALLASPNEALPVSRQNLIIGLPQRDLPARLYQPDADAAPTAASDVLLVFFHGGGWVVGDLDTHDDACAFLSHHVGCKVLSVEYRKSPECPFPGPCEDAADAYRWAGTQIENWNCKRIAVAGDSAGAHLAGYTIYANSEMPTAAALLFYPITSIDFERPSYLERGAGPGLNRGTMRWYWNQFLGSAQATDDVRAVPMLQKWSRKPPAMVIALAWHDPLHDEGVAYAELLRDAGADVQLHTANDMSHGFLRHCMVVPAASDHVLQAAHSLLGCFSADAR